MVFTQYDDDDDDDGFNSPAGKAQTRRVQNTSLEIKMDPSGRRPPPASSVCLVSGSKHTLINSSSDSSRCACERRFTINTLELKFFTDVSFPSPKCLFTEAKLCDWLVESLRLRSSEASMKLNTQERASEPLLAKLQKQQVVLENSWKSV